MKLFSHFLRFYSKVSKKVSYTHYLIKYLNNPSFCFTHIVLDFLTKQRVYKVNNYFTKKCVLTLQSNAGV